MDVNNQGLNLPSNLQNLDVRNELLSTELGSGASCAYSLRDLTGSNKKAVRVRRTPYDTSESINDELDFGGQEIQSGILEDWVNGKLEVQLPADNVAVLVTGGSEVAGKYYPRVKYSSNPDTLEPVFVYYNDNLSVPLKLLRFSSGTSQRWRFERQDNNNAVIDPTNRGTVYNSPTDVPNSDWPGTGNLAITNITKTSQADVAFSLRKVNSSYSGNAVRIRRSSDNTEVDVAFDSEGKVSASSAITNVAEEGGESGQTTATTLGEFINHSGDFGDFRVDDEWSDNLLAFSSVGKKSFSVEAKSLGSFGSTDTVRVSAPITNIIAEPQASITKFKTTFTIDSISGEGNGDATDGALYVKGANTANGNGSWHFTNSPDGAGGNVTFKFTSVGTYTVEGYGEDEADAYNLAFRTFAFIIYSGTKVSVSNVSMEVLNDCSVHTWYDQTKDLTQLSTYFNATLSSSNIAVNAMTEEFGTFLGRDNAVKLTSTAGNTQRFDSIDFGIGAGESVRFTAQIYVPSTNTALDSFAYSEKFDVSGYDRKQGVITPAQDQWVDIDFNYVQSDDTVQRIIFWNSASSTPTANNNSDGDVIYFRNMVVTRVTKGQTDAVQETSGSQPKIAENGALLSDGIEFDGSDDALNFTDLTLTDASIFTVLDIDGTENLQIILGGSTSTTTATMIPMMQTSSTTTQVYKNATVGGAEQGNSQFRNASQITLSDRGDAYSELATKDKMLFTMLDVDVEADKVLDGISQTPSNATTWGLKGKMEELIIYNSDQSDNRFKIESNINNYYGLYNDANAFSANAQVDGTGSTVSNASKDGGTLTLSSASGNNYLYFQLTETVPATSGDIFISFNYESSNDSVTLNNVKLRDDNDFAKSGDLVDSSGSAITIQQNGFYSGKLASGNLSNTGTRLAFLTNQTTNGYTFTISNLRYSRIARDGFVETLYDQSGNSRDASQGTAGSQPFIVRNGGQVKLQNQPSIDFDGRGSSSATGLVTNYDISSDGSLTEYSIYGVFDNTISTPHSTLISAGQPIANSTSYGGFNVFVNQNGGRLEIEHQEHPNTSKTTVRPTNSYTTGDGYKILTINYNSSSLLSKLVNVTSGSSAENTSPALPKARDDIATAQYLKIGGSFTFEYRDAWQGFISEIIIFEDDIRSDNDDIVDNLTDFYGQPSSTP